MFGTSAGGYGASQEVPFGSQISPEKKAKQEDKQTCMPATIRLLLAGQKEAEEKGGELELHGQEVANVTLVGTVEGLVRQLAMLEFTLNDGTGRVQVRHYTNAGIASDSENDGLVNGGYASIVGSIRTSPAVHISAMNLRPVTNADEISHHTIEVAYAALMLKRGGSVAPPVSTTNVATQPSVMAAPPAAATPAATGAQVRAKVLQVLQKENESRPEGVPVAVVLTHLKSLAPVEVRAALAQLVSDGEAFTTIDDEHFSPL